MRSGSIDVEDVPSHHHATIARSVTASPDPDAAGEWIDLVDGNGFLGTLAPSLLISQPLPGLATGYRCRIGGGCGCGPSAGFIDTDTVNFGISCPADFTADGGIDFGDVEAFFERWGNGC